MIGGNHKNKYKVLVKTNVKAIVWPYLQNLNKIPLKKCGLARTVNSKICVH